MPIDLLTSGRVYFFGHRVVCFEHDLHLQSQPKLIGAVLRGGCMSSGVAPETSTKLLDTLGALGTREHGQDLEMFT